MHCAANELRWSGYRGPAFGARPLTYLSPLA